MAGGIRRLTAISASVMRPTRIGETIVVDAYITGIERGVDVDDGAGVIGGLPERGKIGRIQHAAEPAWQRADHDAGKAR